MQIDNYMFELNDSILKWQNSYFNNKNDFNNIYSDSSAGNPKDLQLGFAHFTPNNPNLNWFVSSAAKYWSSTSYVYNDPSTEMKNNIIKIIQKIIDGGKPQLIFSLKSEDDLEKEIAKLLLNLIGIWRTSSEEDSNGTGNKKSN